MADIHELIVTCIIFLYQIYLVFRSIHPIKKDALLLIFHNIMLYYVINMFKHLAQDTINSPGAVNTFYYVPLVYEEPAGSELNHSWHELLRSSSWLFFESLFRHHLVLLLPFNLAILVPRCKLGFISSLVLFSNLVMFGCFASAICQLMISASHAHSLRLLTILCLGPMCQMLLMLRLLVRMWFSMWIVV
ncbi:uncharacterized protein Dana_GF15002, isoform B [Drosophila ananassae]|uniref:Uncharacterized protein, isoform B n=1 Tax=Drosophila ananassae TaxID=7217 RepID=B3MLD9_DROAN|nr:uncharacterized protein LOC6497817 isoform X1 [Drosophila ananassae]XP_044571991.1 uncharacterized protein LOC6497817 isoform X1 [Drosophila ananassae]EDV30728.2 uncharacterized protein Dana_GF15002, isoform B [Drosophila ananassae]